MQESFKITVPEGMEIDKEKSTFECIVFKAKKDKLPRTWKSLYKIKGWYINTESNIREIDLSFIINNEKNVYPTKELAKASLALTQLLQLRDRYNDGWVPDWTMNSNKHCIFIGKNGFVCDYIFNVPKVFAFKTKELRDVFFENFKELLEIAKPLL